MVINLKQTSGTLGARVFARGGHSTAIGCLVLAGKDFPAAVESTLCDWKMTLFLKKDPNKLSTRGLLEYEDTTFGRENSTLIVCYRVLKTCSEKIQIYYRAFEAFAERPGGVESAFSTVLPLSIQARGYQLPSTRAS